jgi:hypothetical protein
LPDSCPSVGEVLVDDVADRPLVLGRHLLLGQGQRADTVHGPLVGCQGAGEYVQQGRLAASVLADDTPARTRGDLHVDLVQDCAATAVDADAHTGQLGPIAGRQVETGHVVLPPEGGTRHPWVRGVGASLV